MRLRQFPQIVSKDQVIAALVQLQRDLAQMNQYVVVNLTGALPYQP
jgi:hypothetical protein